MFLGLNDDVIVRVLHGLCVRSLCSTAITCRRIMALHSTNDGLWHEHLRRLIGSRTMPTPPCVYTFDLEQCCLRFTDADGEEFHDRRSLDDSDVQWLDPRLRNPGHWQSLTLRAQSRSMHEYLCVVTRRVLDVAEDAADWVREHLAMLAPELAAAVSTELIITAIACEVLEDFHSALVFTPDETACLEDIEEVLSRGEWRGVITSSAARGHILSFLRRGLVSQHHRSSSHELMFEFKLHHLHSCT